MSRLFDKCIKDGGDIKTETISSGRFRRICILEGKVFKGKIQTKLMAKRKKKKKY